MQERSSHNWIGWKRKGVPTFLPHTGRQLGRKKGSCILGSPFTRREISQDRQLQKLRREYSSQFVAEKRETCIDAPCYCPEFPSLRFTSPSAYAEEANTCYRRKHTC